MVIKTTIEKIDIEGSINVKNILKRLSSFSGASVSTGFFPSSVYPDGTPIASVAKWNNDGDGNIPERPFFTKGILAGRMSSQSVSRDNIPDLILGNITTRGYLSAIGETYQDSIVAAIDSNMPPPNAPATWEIKMMKGLKKTGQKKFRKMKAEDYGKALEAMDEKYTSGKNEGKYKYRAGGSPKTLIDTGLMRKAVNYKVKLGE